MPAPPFTLTDEQEDAVRLFLEGEDLAVVAGAGAGKTSTILLAANALLDHPTRSGEKGLYLAFNRSIVDEAKRKMPRHVDVRTIHSLAYRQTPKALLDRLNAGRRVRSDFMASVLGITPITVTLPSAGVNRRLDSSYLAGLVMAGITKFCQSADPVPTARHIPYIDGIDGLDKHGRRSYTNNNQVSATLESFLTAAWEDLQKPDGRLRFEHQHYLKMFELSGPNLGVDFIFFDEAQDVSPVFASIVFQQSVHGTQIVLVGDPNQSIYEWNGAIDAFSKLPANTTRTPLTASFRFGPEIASVANEVLADLEADMRITGAGRSGRVAPAGRPTAVLCRTNAKAVETTIELKDAGEDVFLMGGAAEVRSFAFAARDLQRHKPTSHVDLGCFNTWNEVLDYVAADVAGSELKLMVGLMERFGPPRIIAATDNMPRSEQPGQVVVSTAHKAKGREWPIVKIAGDFPGRPEEGDLPAEELRLLYVAVTRAQVQLDLSEARYFGGTPAPSAEPRRRSSASLPFLAQMQV